MQHREEEREQHTDNTEHNREQDTETNTEHHSTENSAHNFSTYSVDFYNEYAYIKNSDTIELYTISKENIQKTLILMLLIYLIRQVTEYTKIDTLTKTLYVNVII